MWDDDKFLQPFMEGDSLLYSFDQDGDFDEDECMASVDEEELAQIMGDAHNICFDDDMKVDADASGTLASSTEALKVLDCSSIAGSSSAAVVNGVDIACDFSDKTKKDKSLRLSFGRVAASEIKKVNENYFGSYSSFGIHREMLSDKVLILCAQLEHEQKQLQFYFV